MAYDSVVVRRATARLEQQRLDRRQECETRRAAILAEIPRAREIERELRGTYLEIARAAFKSPGAPDIGEVRERNLSLQEERAALLAARGYGKDALDDTPLCRTCGDTGWVGTRMCECLRALCAEEQIRELSRLLPLGEQSFDTFRLDFYSDEPWPGKPLSPRENMELVRDVCYSYASRFGRSSLHNLFLSGTPGLGKTFLSSCIARLVSENGFSVVYDTAVNVFAQFETEKFSRESESVGEARAEKRRYLVCDLLILDDLGSELTTPMVQSSLYTLLNTRLMEGKHTVISSNLSIDDVYRRYTPQVASRLDGEFRTLDFYGEDLRTKRAE